MTSNVVNIADYRKRRAQVSQPAPAVPVAVYPMLVPVLSPFGWLVVPVMVPVANGGGPHG